MPNRNKELEIVPIQTEKFTGVAIKGNALADYFPAEMYQLINDANKEKTTWHDGHPTTVKNTKGQEQPPAPLEE